MLLVECVLAVVAHTVQMAHMLHTAMLTLHNPYQPFHSLTPLLCHNLHPHHNLDLRHDIDLDLDLCLDLSLCLNLDPNLRLWLRLRLQP
jgi:hypothetical protein